MEWYKGDGAYGDGPEYHWDYYNSFVIQPFLIDVVEGIGRVSDRWSSLRPGVLDRARRYAAIQERLIAPDGSYPPIGRSIAYRCGAFQLLAQMALRHELPEGVTPAQVRSALSAVIRRTLDAPGTFDAEGWLAHRSRGRAAASGRGLHQHGQPLPLHGRLLAAGPGRDRPLLVGPARRVDRPPRLVGRGPPRRPRDQGIVAARRR